MSSQQTKPEVKLEEWDDELLDEGQGPAAIVVREHLRPAAGSDAPIAPPTFAGRGQGNSSYHCDGNASEWAVVQDAVREARIVNRCTIDSIPSQANRLESALRRYEGTRIPKVTLEGVKNESMSLLDVGHRVADAAVWSADGYEDFRNAIEEYVKGNSAPLGKLAPTSLLFGYWDSRGETGAKARRLIRSEIVATNVVELTRRSQYWASVDPESNEELKKALDEAKAKAKDDQEKDVGSQLGFRDAPASGLGGVIVYGDITRTTILSLTGLRNLAARGHGNEDEAQTLGLRRYLLGLMLAVASSPRGGWDLREGCLLVQERRKEGDKEVPWVECRCVYHDGHESPWQLPGRNHVDEYVELAARAFLAPEFPPNARTLTFNTQTATQRVREKLAAKGDKKGSRPARAKR